MELSAEREEELRQHGFIACEWRYEKGQQTPPVGAPIVAYLRQLECAADLRVVTLTPSHWLINTYIVLLKFEGTLPERAATP